MVYFPYFMQKLLLHDHDIYNRIYKKYKLAPRGPTHIIILMTGGPSDFLGPESLAKSDFFGSMKDAGIFFWVT